jgi:hypothetical protein
MVWQWFLFFDYGDTSKCRSVFRTPHGVPWMSRKSTVRISNLCFVTDGLFRWHLIGRLCLFIFAVTAYPHDRCYFCSFVSGGLWSPHRLSRAVTKSSNLVSTVLRSIYCTEASDFCSDSVDCRVPEASYPVSTFYHPTSPNEQNVVPLILGSVAN